MKIWEYDWGSEECIKQYFALLLCCLYCIEILLFLDRIGIYKINLGLAQVD